MHDEYKKLDLQTEKLEKEVAAMHQSGIILAHTKVVEKTENELAILHEERGNLLRELHELWEKIPEHVKK